MKSEESVLLETAKTAERSGDFAAAFDAWRQLSSMTNRPEYLCQVRGLAKKLGKNVIARFHISRKDGWKSRDKRTKG